MEAGIIGSGSDFVTLLSSGVDSLMEIKGGGGGILCSVSSSDDTSAVVLRTLPAVLFVFRLLPLGAGSRFGVVRLYVTVLVTTLRTLTGLEQALLGVVMASNIRLELQSAGENGEYSALATLDIAVRGDGPVVGEKTGECCCGILNLCRFDIVDLLEVLLALCGVGGGYVGDLNSGALLPEKLLPVDGFEWVPSLEPFESSDGTLFKALGGGLARIGVKALRKSVYAVGGVIGVLNSASCLMTADTQADTGVEHISDGNEADRGV